MATPKNNSEIQWSSLKPKIRKHWGRVTEDDLSQLNGNFEDLVKILRKRYGYGKAQAEIEINIWLTEQDIHAV